MKKLLFHVGFVGLLLVSMSSSLSAQRGERGARGDGGGSRGANSSEENEQRKVIQEKLKAAIAHENLEFKRAMDRIRLDRQASTSDVERDFIKIHAETLQRDHKAALKKLNADLQAAQARHRG